MEKTFVQMVLEQFKYLIDKHSFDILSSVESPRGYRWEGGVKYATEKTYIDIDCTRGESPSFWIGRTKDVKRQSKMFQYLLPIDLIYEYMTFSDEEKAIATSLLGSRKIQELLHHKQVYFQLPKTDDEAEQMELELSAYARIVEKYAKPFLRGDFSKWPAIWKYSVDKGIAEWIQPDRSEFARVAIPQGDGTYKTYGKQQFEQDSVDYVNQLKQHVYKDVLDYVAELKDELGEAA